MIFFLYISRSFFLPNYYVTAFTQRRLEVSSGKNYLEEMSTEGRDLKAVKRGHLENVLNRELDRNPCYFEERTAKACQNLVDYEQATRGGQIPLGGFRREASSFCAPLMKNFDDCKEFW